MRNSQPVTYTVGQRAQVTNELPLQRLTRFQSDTARICRRMLMKLGDAYTRRAIAKLCDIPPEHVSRWADSESPHAPNFTHMRKMPTAALDMLLADLAKLREQDGHEPRQWSAPVTAQVDALAAARAEAEAAVARLAALMRGVR